MSIEYKIGFASQKQICKLLEQCDIYFIPKLSEKVNIEDYSLKIFNKAINIEAWESNDLVGLIAMYVSNEKAFITNVSVKKEYAKRGIASNLLGNCIEYIKDKNIAEIELEVNAENKPALSLYTKFGFKVYEQKDASLFMILKSGVKNV